MIRNARIWVIVGNDWVPAIVNAIREPGMKARDVLPAGNNGKHRDVAGWVEYVCQHTTEAGAVLLSFPEGDAETAWRPWGFPWHAEDPRTWDIWDGAHCAEAGSVPLKTVRFNEARRLRVYGRDGGDHPLFLRTGRFCKVEPISASYRCHPCTVREAK